jgi:hypothetical protein
MIGRLTVSDTRSKGQATLVVRTRDAAASVVPLGMQAGNQAAESVRQGVRGVRGWAAPQLHGAADAVDSAVAPKVSSALRAAGRKVSPDSETNAWQRGLQSMLSWRGVAAVLAIITAAGAAAAVTMRRRYASATAEAEDATADADSSDGDTNGETNVKLRGKDNNKVSTSGW